ncbi:response regulator [Candidatus Poribacteria bacterium]|nr:MAG: response regulator [Candidatus Poribacteria bacterium]
MARILIIEDDLDFVESLRLPLESRGHQVEVAESGKVGLQKVKEFEPDLIILDVMMETDTEGFHVAYQLRNPDPSSEYAKYSDIPIIMLTAISQKTKMAFDPKKDEDFLPVDEFIEKPVRPDVLLEKVEKLLKEKGKA